MGAKSFSLAFDGGRTAPYHIVEKRGKFVGSLWLGSNNLKWLLQTWVLLRQGSELKGFFCFMRTEYSTLELSCLQNQRGRFVELCEYHRGAQRGGIRVPEGYLGKGWNRFAEELNSFFLGKQPPVELRDGESRNRKIPVLGARDSRDFAARIKPSARSLLSSDLNSNQNRIPLDPLAPRLTLQFFFKWEPVYQSLRITKPVGEKRQAQRLGLKHKAHGLSISTARAFPSAQDLAIGSGLLKLDPKPFDDILDPSSSCPVDSLSGKEAESSSDEFDDDIEVNEMAVVCFQEDSVPLPAVWVDLAPPDRASPIGSDLEALKFPFLSDTVYEVGESSHFVGSSSEGVDAELSLTLVEEPPVDTASPLCCEPLEMVIPSGPSECVDGSPVEPSVWVKQRHRGFCKLLGFPIDTHEQECLALLQRIEAYRFSNKDKRGSRRPINFYKKSFSGASQVSLFCEL